MSNSVVAQPKAMVAGERISPLAGKPAPKEMLIDIERLGKEYFERRPDISDPNQLVSFGTSGHRGSPLHGTFTEAHILAITQAICDYRRGRGTDGPLYMGKDTHALSGPAQHTALTVLAANNVETVIQQGEGVTPTPVISRAILVYTAFDILRFARTRLHAAVSHACRCPHGNDRKRHRARRTSYLLASRSSAWRAGPPPRPRVHRVPR